jgi:hypothetical protein
MEQKLLPLRSLESPSVQMYVTRPLAPGAGPENGGHVSAKVSPNIPWKAPSLGMISRIPVDLEQGHQRLAQIARKQVHGINGEGGIRE